MNIIPFHPPARTTAEVRNGVQRRTAVMRVATRVPWLPVLLVAGVFFSPFNSMVAQDRGRVSAPRLQELLDRGDAAMRAVRLEDATRILREAERLQPDNPDVLWRMAKLHVDLSGQESADDRKRVQLDRALTYARSAVAADSTHSMAWTSLAICHGENVHLVGAAEKLELSKLVKRYAEQAVRLDGSNHVALLILGIWNREVATLNWFLKAAVKLAYGGMPPASLEESRRLLARSVALRPNEIMPRLELAKTLREMDDDAGAIRELRTALRLPPADAGDAERLAEARALLEDLT